MKFLLRASRPSQANRAKLPILCTAGTLRSTAVCPALQRFRRFAILPENAAAALRGKWPGFVEARLALAHPVLNSKSPAARTQSAGLLLATGAPDQNPSAPRDFALSVGAASRSPGCARWRTANL